MDDVKDILEKLGVPQYFAAFEDNDIDMSLIGGLTMDDLKEIGITSLGHRKKVYAAFQAAVAQPAEYFAPEPAPAIAQDTEIEAELRDVTTIFTDLSGYSALSREVDTEHVHDILSIFYERFNEIVMRMGGTVARHIGDCVMAVFGAPVSYGNDTERALRAAVEMHRAMETISRSFGRELTVHIGAAVGNVLFSKRGYGQRRDRDFTVTGDTVNLASRLAAQAEARETLIDERIFLSLSHKIECDTPVALDVKGYAEPVLAHRFVGFREAATQSRLIGRDREMAVFRKAIADCLERGSGEAIYVCGDAGIGKTRLLQETVQEAERAGFDSHSTLFLDFGLGEAQNPLNQLVRSMCGLGDRAQQSAVAATMSRLKAAGVLTEVSAIFVILMLGGKLDREMTLKLGAMSEGARTESRNETLRQLLRHFSAGKPQLLLVEDLHWADARMLPLVNILIEESQTNPILALITSRKEGPVTERDIAPLESFARVRQMTLEPLKSADAKELARATIRVTDRMVEECIRRAQGNPLFLVQILIHANETADFVPSSIQSLIQARFDRLGQVDRRILQAAAILGQRFSMEAVTQVAGVSVYNEDTLVQAALITPIDDGYLFAHALIRDAILRTILRREQHALHMAAARWFAGRDLVLHAQHLSAAGDAGAAEAFLTAAREARDNFQKEEALVLARAGLGCTPDRATQGELLRIEGDMLRETGQSEASIACFQSAEDCAETPQERCQAQIGVVAAMRILDRIDDAFAVLDRAQAIAEKVGLLPELSQIHYLRGSLFFPRGNLEGCREEHARSLDYARRANLPRHEALALSGLGDAAYARGQMFTAHKAIEKCLALSAEHGFGDVESANLFMLATVEIYMNRTARALDNALRSAELAESIGTHRPEIVSRLTAGWILTSMARFDEARVQVERGLALSSKLGARRFEPFLEETIARIEFYEGDRPRAAATAEAALAELREAGAETFIGPWVLSTVALTAPDAARRRAALAEAEALLGAGCVGHNYFRFYRNAMQACLDAGEFDEAARFADALESYTAEEPTPWSDFHIARTRAMLAVACDGADPASLEMIAERAREAGLLNSLPGRPLRHPQPDQA